MTGPDPLVLPDGTSRVVLPDGAVPVVAGRLVGVDAGGRSTRVAIAEGGRIIGWRQLPPMNAVLTPDVAERLAALVVEERGDVMGVGMPGVRTDERAQQLASDVAAQSGRVATVVVDAEIARLGAFLGGPGIIVAAGTGSVAIGSDGERSARAGGHGFLLGDDGGAYWIGREAVRSALRLRDGVPGSERLAQVVQAASGVSTEELVGLVYQHATDRSLLARLAPAVTELARTDAVAATIVDEAGRRLAELAEHVRARLGPLPVAGIGGVFSADLVWDAFAARCGAQRPLGRPEGGALLLAAAALGSCRR